MTWVSAALRAVSEWNVHDCALCGARATQSGDELLCRQCDASLPPHPCDACPQCAIASSASMLCGNCLADPPAFDAAHAAFVYRFPVDRMIHAFKYSANLAIGAFLARRLVASLRAAPLPDLVAPLPLARGRVHERGFNQAALIAEDVSRQMVLPLRRELIERTRETAPQTGLNWKARRANVKGAFSCTADLRGKHVALVDDVMTTGATMHEAALTLRKCGATRVSAWIVARAEREFSTAQWETDCDAENV